MYLASRWPAAAHRPIIIGCAAMRTFTATGVRQTSFAKKIGKNLQILRVQRTGAVTGSQINSLRQGDALL